MENIKGSLLFASNNLPRDLSLQEYSNAQLIDINVANPGILAVNSVITVFDKIHFGASQNAYCRSKRAESTSILG